jgi:hypothetical protein
MEAVAGDNGVHTVNPVWWLSPDIRLIGPVSGPDTADAGQVNTVDVKFHRKASSSNCQFPGDESISVELWVANPSLVMAPNVSRSATRIGFIGSPMLAEGGKGTQHFGWTPPRGLIVDDPQSAGPKCLVARSYPESGTPSSSIFFLPTDQHVAQHNLCVIKAGTHGVRFKVNTLNPGPSLNLIQPSQVKLRAILDQGSQRVVRSIVSKRLQGITGFQQLRTSAFAGGFKFDLASFQVSEVVDQSQPVLSPRGTPVFYEARVALQSRRVSQIDFVSNLQGVNSGEACIFHLIQTSINDVVQGGMTLVVLKL